MITLSTVAELFHADRQMLNPTVAFGSFANSPNKNKRDRQYAHVRNFEAVSRNLCCCG
jgi:hypothetical protein